MHKHEFQLLSDFISEDILFLWRINQHEDSNIKVVESHTTTKSWPKWLEHYRFSNHTDTKRKWILLDKLYTNLPEVK